MLFRKKKQKAKPQPKPSVKKAENPKNSPPQWRPTYVPPTNKTTEKKDDKKENLKKAINSVYGVERAEKKKWDKEFLKTFSKLTYRHRAWDVWKDFIIMFACSISNPVDKTHYEEREARYLKIINKYNKEDQKIFPELSALTIMALDDNPEQDFLGKMFMSLNLGNEAHGQFFTPYHICQLMADIAVGDHLNEIEEKGFVSIHDCCCGAGAMFIAAIHSVRKQLERMEPPLNYQNHILIVGQDIDEIVALMCYIQISFLGAAGFVKVGNALTDPITDKDSTENYWFTPMYFSDIWTWRRIFHSL